MTLIETLEDVLHKSNKVIIDNGKKAKGLCPIFSSRKSRRENRCFPNNRREVTMAASPMRKSECPQVEL